MENVSKTVVLQQIAQILTLGATSTSTAHTEAHATETATETAHATAHTTETANTEATASVCTEGTCNHVVATVSHVVATEEVKESLSVSIAIDETKIVGAELSEIWAAVRNNEINLNELFSTELSFVNGCLSIAIAPRVATV